MKKTFPFSIVIVFLLSACSLFESESFDGEWNFKLTGDYDGEISVFVGEDMSYSESTVVKVNNRDFDVKFSGKINEDGSLIGIIYAQGQQVGEMNGKLNFDNGEGKWNAANIGGTWTCVKKQ